MLVSKNAEGKIRLFGIEIGFFGIVIGPSFSPLPATITLSYNGFQKDAIQIFVGDPLNEALLRTRRAKNMPGRHGGRAPSKSGFSAAPPRRALSLERGGFLRQAMIYQQKAGEFL